jgi:hypothetical protein
MTEAAIRGQMHTLMRETLAEEARLRDWTYAAIRPMPVPPIFVYGRAKRSDCSKGCQYLAKWGGAPDPMGRGFDAYGNSTTMTILLDHLDHLGELKVGDYVTFGYYGEDHAAAVMALVHDRDGHVVDVILWSDGHQGAPNEYRLSWDHRYRRLLRNPIPHPLTPMEKLRAKTGFWAWVQWRKGTGAWRGHGKRNKKVRPNIPRTIPARWWKRYAAIFLIHNRGANPATT